MEFSISCPFCFVVSPLYCYWSDHLLKTLVHFFNNTKVTADRVEINKCPCRKGKKKHIKIVKLIEKVSVHECSEYLTENIIYFIIITYQVQNRVRPKEGNQKEFRRHQCIMQDKNKAKNEKEKLQ